MQQCFDYCFVGAFVVSTTFTVNKTGFY